MRIACFSDVDSNLPALEAVPQDIKGQAIDKVYLPRRRPYIATAPTSELGSYAPVPSRLSR